VVDVGGGASTLVDDLLAAGYLDITVLDIAATGMDIAKKRLGKHHVEVKWIVEDLLDWQPDRRYALWHDRAVLHFLTERGDQEQYRAKLLAATDPGSVAVIGVFGPDGPTSCSGLPTTRYDSQRLRDFLGEDFVVAESQLRDHVTPAQATQQFLWSVATRVTQ
jgi:trans-aconitate methyltransferase